MGDEGESPSAEQQTEAKKNKDSSTSYTIHKVHVRPGKPFSTHESGEASSKWTNFLTTLPKIPEKADKYKPMPYTFRLPSSPKSTHIKNVVAKSPPFHLLLDNAIAVIWMIFSDEEYDSPLGIVQLQWALAFLKTIYTRMGETPKDVELCIENIEDILIEQYAVLANQLSIMEKIENKVKFIDGALGTKSVIMQKIPFSQNYQQIFEKLGEEKIQDVPSITSTQAQEELDNLKKAAGVESIEKLDSVSRDKAINVLKSWYSEQTGKVKEEMKKLKSIEDQIKNVNDGTFQYLDAAQMELLFMEDD